MYTPGPWIPEDYVSSNDYGNDMIDIYDPRGYLVAQARAEFHPKELDPNARLIAAAPELLEALEEARKRVVHLTGWECECDNTHEENGTTCAQCYLKSVIDKAKGN